MMALVLGYPTLHTVFTSAPKVQLLWLYLAYRYRLTCTTMVLGAGRYRGDGCT